MNEIDQTSRRRLTRHESKARTREALLSAARQVFAAEGYSSASLDQIAAEAGYTKGAVYAHFASKEDLFLELMSSGLMRQIEILEALLADARAAPDRLEPLLNQLLDELDRPGTNIGLDLSILGVELQLESRRNSQIAEGFANTIDRHRLALKAVVAEVFRIGGARPAMDIDLYSGTVIAIVEGLALSRAGGLQGTVAPTRLVLNILLGLQSAVQTADRRDREKRGK